MKVCACDDVRENSGRFVEARKTTKHRPAQTRFMRFSAHRARFKYKAWVWVQLYRACARFGKPQQIVWGFIVLKQSEPSIHT